MSKRPRISYKTIPSPEKIITESKKIILPKEKIVLQTKNNRLCSCNNRLQSLLENSGYFNIEYEDFPYIKEMGDRRFNFLSFARFRGKLIGIDTWDASHPASCIPQFYENDKFLQQLKLVLKIQYKHNDVFCEKVVEPLNKIGIKIDNWIMFPSVNFPYIYFERFQWEYKPNYKYLFAITGKRREDWIKHFRDKNYAFTPRNPVKRNHEAGDFSVYMDVLKNCKWGLILAGKSGYKMDTKNTREVEYSFCGIPLAMNYQPDYNFNFIPDKHYVYVKNIEDAEKLHNIDPKPYSEASKQIYKNYFSPIGATKLFIEIINKNLL